MLREVDDGYRHWRKDGHNAAFLFHLMSLVLSVTSLVQLPWFHIRGCSPPSLGPKYFLTLGGHFDAELAFPSVELVVPPTTSLVSIKYHSDNNVLECISPEVLCLMRLLAFLCILCIIASMIGFCLDIIRPVKRPLRFMRRNAIPGVFAVLFIILMIGVSYFLTTSLELAAREQHKEKFIQVSYDYGFYAISAAGGLSLIATACNILQEPGVTVLSRSVLSRRRGLVTGCQLLEDDPFSETFTISHPPPPPPYSP